MKRLIFSILISLFLSTAFSVGAFATLFVPISIEKQVEEADFAVEATLRTVKVHKNSTGLIMSDYTFVVNEGFGFKETEFHLDMPGGTLEGVTTTIDSSPRFIEGQRVFLLLKRVESKIYLSNFTMGQYKIVEIDKRPFYRSEVFPYDPQIGVISKEKMKELMNEKWKYSLDVQEKNKSLTKISKFNSEEKSVQKANREPAQALDHENKENVLLRITIIGSLIVFAVAFIILLRKKKS